MVTYVYHKTRASPRVRLLIILNNNYYLIIVMLSFFPQKIAPFFMEKLFALTHTEYKDYSTKINGVNFSESARLSSFLDFIPVNNEYKKIKHL